MRHTIGRGSTKAWDATLGARSIRKKGERGVGGGSTLCLRVVRLRARIRKDKFCKQHKRKHPRNDSRTFFLGGSSPLVPASLPPPDALENPSSTGDTAGVFPLCSACRRTSSRGQWTRVRALDALCSSLPCVPKQSEQLDSKHRMRLVSASYSC